eukprot:TRINITY_DN7093_c0_g1_i4.p1 TRINITY_DN7093_c0_g1~~TRINITY_DN7093_c0_g1_i4.p1  ORF type:complete len:907 (+),score=147.77 TRINITY_DN7093_c0_g1_i4:131-2851(+)
MSHFSSLDLFYVYVDLCRDCTLHLTTRHTEREYVNEFNKVGFSFDGSSSPKVIVVGNPFGKPKMYTFDVYVIVGDVKYMLFSKKQMNRYPLAREIPHLLNKFLKDKTTWKVEIFHQDKRNQISQDAYYYRHELPPRKLSIESVADEDEQIPRPIATKSRTQTPPLSAPMKPKSSPSKKPPVTATTTKDTLRLSEKLSKSPYHIPPKPRPVNVPTSKAQPKARTANTSQVQIPLVRMDVERDASVGEPSEVVVENQIEPHENETYVHEDTSLPIMPAEVDSESDAEHSRKPEEQVLDEYTISCASAIPVVTGAVFSPNLVIHDVKENIEADRQRKSRPNSVAETDVIYAVIASPDETDSRPQTVSAPEREDDPAAKVERKAIPPSARTSSAPKGMWSCCFEMKRKAPGCQHSYHRKDALLCKLCGSLYNPHENGEYSCLHHKAFPLEKRDEEVWPCCRKPMVDRIYRRNQNGALDLMCCSRGHHKSKSATSLDPDAPSDNCSVCGTTYEEQNNDCTSCQYHVGVWIPSKHFADNRRLYMTVHIEAKNSKARSDGVHSRTCAKYRKMPKRELRKSSLFPKPNDYEPPKFRINKAVILRPEINFNFEMKLRPLNSQEPPFSIKKYTLSEHLLLEPQIPLDPLLTDLPSDSEHEIVRNKPEGSNPRLKVKKIQATRPPLILNSPEFFMQSQIKMCPAPKLVFYPPSTPLMARPEKTAIDSGRSTPIPCPFPQCIGLHIGKQIKQFNHSTELIHSRPKPMPQQVERITTHETSATPCPLDLHYYDIFDPKDVPDLPEDDSDPELPTPLPCIDMLAIEMKFVRISPPERDIILSSKSTQGSAKVPHKPSGPEERERLEIESWNGMPRTDEDIEKDKERDAKKRRKKATSSKSKVSNTRPTPSYASTKIPKIR